MKPSNIWTLNTEPPVSLKSFKFVCSYSVTSCCPVITSHGSFNTPVSTRCVKNVPLAWNGMDSWCRTFVSAAGEVNLLLSLVCDHLHSDQTKNRFNTIKTRCFKIKHNCQFTFNLLNSSNAPPSVFFTHSALSESQTWIYFCLQVNSILFSLFI